MSRVTSKQGGTLPQTHQFKVVLLGEGCVGKTSLVLRYVENKFTEQHHSTLQASFLKKTLTVDGNRAHLNIWDTAGQERFHALGPIYYRDSNGALLVYDVTDPDSLSKVKTWVKELKKMLGSTVCLAIVGNKADLLPVVEQKNPTLNPLVKEAIQYAESVSQSMGNQQLPQPASSQPSSSSSFSPSAVHYLTSAKSNQGIDETFLDLTRRMVKYYEKTSSASSASNNGRGVLRVAEDEEGEELQTNGSKCSC